MTGALLRVARADRRTVWLWAITIVVVGLAARVGWAAWIAHADPSAVRSPDTPSYLWPARALIDAGRFSLSPTDTTPMFVRTPGYPAFLVPILWVTNSEWAISPIQAAVSAVAVVTIVLVGRRLIGLTAGLVAGVLLVLDPLQFAASGTILTESIASVVLAGIVALGFVVFALRRPQDVPPVAVFALGALVAVATLVRPTMWFYPVVLLAMLAIRFRGVPRRAQLARLLVFVLPIVVVVGGWQARNHSAVGSWQVSGASGLILYCSNAAEAEARATDTSLDVARGRLGCPTPDNNPRGVCTSTVGWNCQIPDPEANGQGFDEWSRQGLDIMADHPLQAARTEVEGAVRLIAGPGTDTVRRYLDADASIPLTIGLFLWNAALWVFAAVGAIAGLRSRYRAFWAFVIATIGYTIVISASGAAGARYRTPLVPLLALLAALGIQSSLRKLRGSRPQPPPARDQHTVAAAGVGR